jgi:HK97 family phage prohead protease
VTTHVLERRNLTGPVEYRAVEGDTGAVAVGTAAVFGKWSVDLNGFRERIDPGAFTRTLRNADVVALWNHESHALLGRVSSGTLRLTADDEALRYEIDLPDTTTGRDVEVLLRRKDIRGSSFGFRTIRDKWEEDEDGNVSRTLLEAALIDVSPVARPAYPDTDAGLRSLADIIGRPFSEVRAAAEQRHLGSLLFPTGEPETPPSEPEDEARAEPTFAHRRLSWAY